MQDYLQVSKYEVKHKKVISRIEYKEYVTMVLGNRHFKEVLMKMISASENEEIQKLCLKYFLVYYVRDARKEELWNFVKKIERMFGSKLKVACYFCENFSVDLINELLLSHKNYLMKNLILSLFHSAFKTIVQREDKVEIFTYQQVSKNIFEALQFALQTKTDFRTILHLFKIVSSSSHCLWLLEQ